MATITILFMDAPYESSNSMTAMRLIDAAIRKGHNVNVLAYEGAAAYTFAAQKPHPNPIKGTGADEERHPNTKDWVSSLLQAAEQKGVKLDWIRCGMCEDERGVHEHQTPGTRRGSPVDFFEQQVAGSDNTLVIPCR
jgi:tRNA 2-thiouridine synthesizing protein D